MSPKGGRIMKHKKYNLILGTDDNSHSIIAYRKTSRGYSIEPISKVLGLNKKEYQFMQSEIDSIKSNLDDPKQRAIVDLAKHEVKEPLYYMQSTRSNECGERLFFMRAPSFSGLEDLSYTLFPSIEEAMYGWSKMIYLRPKEEWEPYIAPDRELVKYEEG